MTVYVDLLFAVNAVINYLLLRGSAAMGGCPVRFRRLAAAAAAGGVYAVLVVLPRLEVLQKTVFQLVSAIGMVLLAFGWKRSTAKQGLFFFALSFAFSGVVLLAVQAAEPDCVFLNGRAYYGVTTPALLLLAGACYAMAALVLRGWGTHTGGDLAELELELNGRRTTLKALRDTGNMLLDPMSGQPILVAEWKVLARLLPEAGLTRRQFLDPASLLDGLAGRFPELRVRLVPYRSVGTAGGLLPAVGCRVMGKRRPERQLVAFTATELSARGQYEALMGGMIV